MATKLAPIQALRAYAAILVVINHLWTSGAVASYLGFDNIGGFGVCIFFVISGFIISYSIPESIQRLDNLQFLRRRIYRLFPMYLLAFSIFAVLYLHSAIMHGQEVDFPLLLGNALLLPSFTNNTDYRMLDGPAWTLVYEMFFYYIFFVFISILNRKSSAIVLTAVFIILIVSLMQFFNLQGPKLGWVNFSYIVGDPVILNFASGCFLYLAWNKWGGKTPLNFLAAFVGFVGLTLIAFAAPHPEILRILWFMIPTIIVAIHLLADFGHSKKIEFIEFLGAASFSIYLFHPLIYQAIIRIPWLSNLHGDLFGAASVVVGLLLGCLVYFFIEKPVNQFLLYRRVRRPAVVNV